MAVQAPAVGEARFAAIVGASFALVVGVGLARHEPWLDELQAYAIAFFAAGPADLLARMAYEGHPPFWHALIWLATRVAPGIGTMQVLAGVIATAIAFLIAWRAPFSRLQRVLICFGYFPLFEYGVIARGYGLGLLLLVAHAALRTVGERRAWLLALPLAGAALTSAYGLVLAWGLAIVWLVTELDSPDGQPREAPWAGLALLVIATGATLWLMAPPADASFKVGLAAVGAERAVWATYAPFWGFCPFPDPASPSPWNSSPFANRPLLGNLAYLAGGLTPWLAALALLGRPAALAGFASGAAVLWVFCYVGYAGSLRHHGHFFLLWLLCLWLAVPAGPRVQAWWASVADAGRGWVPAGGRPALAGAIALALALATWQPLAGWSAPLLLAAATLGFAAASLGWLPTLAAGATRLGAALRPHGRALSGLLALHVAAAAWLLVADFQRPFSQSAALAAAVPAGSDAVHVVDTFQTNHLGPSLAARLGRSVVYESMAGARPGEILVWDASRPPFTGNPSAEARLADVQRVLWRLAKTLPAGRPALIATEIVVPEFPPGLPAGLLATGPPALASDEPSGMSLYIVIPDRQAGATCPL